MRSLAFIFLVFIAGCSGRQGEITGLPPEDVIVGGAIEQQQAPSGGFIASDDSYQGLGTPDAPLRSPEPYYSVSDVTVDEDDGFIISLGREYESEEAFEMSRAPAAQTSDGAQTAQVLGTITASLGTVSERGVWASASFVTTPQPAVLRDPQTGNSVVAELRPVTGSERMSLEAYQALGIDPRQISRITVEAP